MKGFIGFSAMLFAMMASQSNFSPVYRQQDDDPLSNREVYTPPKKDPPMPKGFRQWEIDGKTVWATTKKAAIKKASKLP